jgi:demethylmenaquinone methyltransferase/2-methoxy-6-polyprenyl-1,4-benzoquinol methylase
LSEPDAEELIDEQIAYYRARAPWYDDWWYRRGQHERDRDGDGGYTDRWYQDVDAMLADFEAWITATRPQRVLELASGTGEFTRRMLAQGVHVTAVDASPEVHEISASKLDDESRARVEYVEADLFSWRPAATFDAVVFGFWLSHVPRGRVDAFWTLVHSALAPGGQVWLTDDAPPERWWDQNVLERPANPRIVEGAFSRLDRETDVHERSLPDGRTFKLVKRFLDPSELERELNARGFDARITTTDWAFIIGRLTRR